jgi:signal transduction histidine kinase
MHSFLGVPIAAGEEVIAAFYLTEKLGAPTFSDADQALIELLAIHAAIAITNAQARERSRELSALEERNRLALELHDVVSQKLFSVVLTAEAAATQLERDPPAAAATIARTRELAREALDELRSLILGLRPPDLARDGLEEALRKEATMLGRIHGVAVHVRTAGELPADSDPPRDAALLRIAGEALHNAVRHAAAQHIEVALEAEDRHVRVSVRDDGVGFDPGDPALRARHLGLTSMEARARELGGRLEITSAPGAGSAVTAELPRRR